jgi:hypothetical protein
VFCIQVLYVANVKKHRPQKDDVLTSYRTNETSGNSYVIVNCACHLSDLDPRLCFPPHHIYPVESTETAKVSNDESDEN